MISVNYVNNTKQVPKYFDPLVKIEREMDEIMNGLEIAYQEYVTACNVYDLDATFLEAKDIDPKKKDNVEAKGKDFVSNLGASVIAIFKKAIAFISDVIGKIKEKFSSHKEKFSKAEAICKQNPKLNKFLTDEVKAAIDKGDMSITDLKALAELDREYEQLVELAKKKDVNPNSLKAKWDNAVKKFENSNKAPIIAGVVGIATVITAIGQASNYVNRSKTELNDSLTAMMDWSTNNKDAADLANKGPMRILADAARYRSHQHITAANKANSIVTFLANVADEVLKRASGYDSSDRHAPGNSDTLYSKAKRDLVSAARQNKEQRDFEAATANERHDARR